MIRNTINNKGFTLIELLVVIAIIGILAAVVLASLSDARDEAKKSAIIQQVDNMAKLLEINSLQTPGIYYTDANQAYWIRNSGGDPSCDNVALNGLTTENQVKFRELCNGIVEQSNYVGSQALRISWYQNHASYGNHYSITAKIDAATIACAGSSGGRYVGLINPGTGNWSGAGCFLNP